MSFFKKRVRAVGKGADENIFLHKEFEVLNCTPVDYKYTTQYVSFMNHAEANFRKIIAKTAIDDLCGDMFDAHIDSIIKQMKESAKEQYTYHMHTIDHHKGLLDGELVRAKGHLDNLKQDLDDIEEEIGVYKQIKRERHIF